MLENYPSLLVTKLYIPPVRSAHVRRADLLAALDAGHDRRLILVAAAAGFGKTTLLADWAARHNAPVAWLSLDEGDSDPVRFLSYFVAAIQSRIPNVGGDLLGALQSSQPPPAENAARMLINQLAASPGRLIVALDDYHVVVNPAVHTLLTFLLEHLPPHVTLAILTRSDPPLPLARLRANNDLLEIRAASLRFSEDETAHFLGAMGIELAPGAISALDTRTEGWIAGLQLAALAMQSLPGDRELFIRDFSGDHQFVLDYLIEEVLARQPEDVRRFLLQSAILRRLSAPLCAAVAGIDDGAAMIEALEKNNLFLIPLDQTRGWYRYHHLFADLLLARLRAEQPDQISGLYRRAAAWHAENGLPEEAVDYALAGGDYERAAALILGAADGPMRRGEVATLMRWYGGFPPEFLSGSPRLVVQFALMVALGGRWEEAGSMIDGLAGQEDHLSPVDRALLAYLLPGSRPEPSRMAALARDTTTDTTTRTSMAILISTRGDLDTACDILAGVQEESERTGDWSLLMTALFHRCRLHVYQGQLRRAHDLIDEALARAAAMGAAAIPMAAFGHSALGRVLIEWNEPDRAEEHLREAMHLAEETGFVTGMLSSCAIMLGEVAQARGDMQAASGWVETALGYAARFDPAPEGQWMLAYQARLWLAQGNLPAARKWLDETEGQTLPESLIYPQTILAVTRARALIALRKPDQAVALLVPLLDRPRDMLSVEALGALALARQVQADAVHARIALEQALSAAEEENRVTAFLILGPAMSRLLAHFCQDNPDHAFARRVLAAYPPLDQDTTPAEPLSEREIEVLRLIAAGRSNEEIAEALTIALSTVKWYVNTLYAKLHVKTRAQAIARIHALRLLDD